MRYAPPVPGLMRAFQFNDGEDAMRLRRGGKLLLVAGLGIYLGNLAEDPPQGLPPAAAETGVEPGQRFEYQVLATSKTTTMQKEMNEAARAGFRFEGVMGGETAFGGSEVVVVMGKDTGREDSGRYEYRLLATSKTSTMQKELQEAAEAGFDYRGQSVFETTFGGSEVVVILEHDRQAEPARDEYKLLATKKTSTMRKELAEAGSEGFSFVGLTVAPTAMGGNELVGILRRPVAR